MSRHSSFSAFFALFDLDPMEAPRTFADYRWVDKTDSGEIAHGIAHRARSVKQSLKA